MRVPLLGMELAGGAQLADLAPMNELVVEGALATDYGGGTILDGNGGHDN